MIQFRKKSFQATTALLIKKTRKQRGFTQKQIADVLNMKRSSYANIENGRQRIPLDVVWRLAIFLKVKHEEIIPEPVQKEGKSDE